MKKILLILFCLCFFALKSHATHIVGGEVRLIYLGTNNNYRIVLNVYFDNINGSTAAIDPTLNVGVYSKTSRNLIEFFTLNQISPVYTRDTLCGGTTDITHIEGHHDEIYIFPNPFSNYIKLKNISSNVLSELQVQIFDGTGRSVMKFAQRILNKFESLEINTINLSSGLYFVEFRSDNNLLIRKKVICLK